MLERVRVPPGSEMFIPCQIPISYKEEVFGQITFNKSLSKSKGLEGILSLNSISRSGTMVKIWNFNQGEGYPIGFFKPIGPDVQIITS